MNFDVHSPQPKMPETVRAEIYFFQDLRAELCKHLDTWKVPDRLTTICYVRNVDVDINECELNLGGVIIENGYDAVLFLRLRASRKDSHFAVDGVINKTALHVLEYVLLDFNVRLHRC